MVEQVFCKHQVAGSSPAFSSKTYKMKKLIEYILKNITVFAIGAIVVFLLLSGVIYKCTSKEIDNTIEQVDINSIRRNLIDSMAKLQHQEYISAIDSINTLRTAQIKSISKTVDKLNKENKQLRNELAQLYNDTAVMDLPTCLEITEIQKDIIVNRDSVVDKQDEQIATYQITLTDLNLKYESQLKETVRTQEMYKACGVDNDKLKQRLAKQNTWWRRNEKWMFLGAGIIGTTLLLK